MPHANEVHISGRLRFPPKCGRGKTDYAFLKCEQDTEKSEYANSFEVAAFDDVAREVAQMGLREGDEIEVIGWLKGSNIKGEDTYWHCKAQVIAHEVTLMDEGEGSSKPPVEPPAQSEFETYEDSGFDDDDVPF